LLVEDEAPVRMFSSYALTNKGYKIVEASSGEEALEVMKNQGEDIDIIITDVIMPGMNGPSLISKIQTNYPKVKVIFISGYAEEAFSDAYGVENDNDFNFLSKPFTLQQLVAKVKDVLEMKIKA
jgi:two-component system cell cycle sensor histidine kinase/response regulator CckA